AALRDPALLPSARVLAATKAHGDSFTAFIRERSAQTRDTLLALPFSALQQAQLDRMTQTSIEAQKRIEASDTMPFEIYREQYVSPARLGFKNHWAEQAVATR
ncbi:MAG TPA: hypothetical protein VGI11_05910, partial [Variovorax sp.]